jgi:transmembrane sensor
MNNSSSPSSPHSDLPAEAAAAWFLRMQEGDCSEADHRAFEEWLAASETHRSEYRQYEALWQNLDRLEGVSGQLPRKKISAAVGLVAAFAVTLFAVQWYLGLGETISTAVGERRHVVLADGTSVDMNTGSKIRVKMSDGLRRVTLVQGEVLLAVAHDARPFEVYAGEGVLRDIGTTFNVRSDDVMTNVTVLEGEVQVSLQTVPPLSLHAGQQVDYEAQGHGAVIPAGTADVTAWLNGRLIFRNAPLLEVVKQINRYHSRPVELADAKLGSLKVSGEFNSADRDGLLEALKILLSLTSTEHLGSTELASGPPF